MILSLGTTVLGGFSCTPAYSKGVTYVETRGKCKVRRVDLKGTSLVTTRWSGNCQGGFANGPGTITRIYRDGVTITDTGMLAGKALFNGHFTRKFSKNNKVDFQYDFFMKNNVAQIQCDKTFINGQNRCQFTDTDSTGFILGELGKRKIVGVVCEKGKCHQADGVIDYSSAKPLMDIFDPQKHTWAPSETILSNNNELYSQFNKSSSRHQQKTFATASKELFASYLNKEELIVYEVIESSIGTKKSISKLKKTNNSIDLLRFSKESEVPVKMKVRISLAKSIFKPIADEYNVDFFLILFAKYTVNSGYSSKKEYAALNNIQHVILKKADDYTAIVEFDLGDLFLSWSSHIATIHTSDATVDTYDVYSFIF